MVVRRLFVWICLSILCSWRAVSGFSREAAFAMWGSARRVQPLSLHANDEIGVVDATCVLEGKETTTRKGFFRQGMTVGDYSFNYQANKLVLGSSKGRDRKATTGIVLLHPIGVGIGRWYYNRLLDELSKQNKGYSLNETFVLVPDLLASGSASEPTMNGTSVQRLPLFRVSDWTQQIVQLMEQTEKDLSKEVEWCIVSNGGCVPIALDIARCYEESDSLSGLKQLVLSATPRLSGLLRDSPPPQKVEKAYKTLTGIVGRLFWWYSLRRDGRFIQQFSERNLAADPANLGKDWTPQCLHTAVSKPNSRYSTFAFLAGALQMDCKPSFEAVKNKTIIDVIVGGDKRRNPARRWLWQKRKKAAGEEDTRLADYLQQNGNRGMEITVGGRRCPAHEDAKGFAEALVTFLCK